MDALRKTKGKAELIFDSPMYEIDYSGSDKIIFSLDNFTDKIINGNSALIIIKNPTVGFMQLRNAENCIIQNFNIDYNPLPFVQSRITSVDYDKGSFICVVDKGFSNFDTQHVKQAPQNWSMLKDANHPGRNKVNAKAHYPKAITERLSENDYLVKLNKMDIQNFKEGDYYIQIARYNGSVSFSLTNCNKISLIGLNVYASPAGVFKSNFSSEVNILNCGVLVKEGRYCSSNADCMHHVGTSIGPWIENCVFEGHSDDTFNLKWKKALIKNQPTSNQITINGSCQTGEMLWLYNPRDGILIDTVRVIKAVRENNQTYHLVIDKDLPDLITGKKDQRGDIVYFDSNKNESFVFRNNIIRNHRRYGILLQSSYGLIENNRFEACSNSAITIENGVDWGEGFVGEHLIIRNNTFVNNGYDDTYIDRKRGCVQIQTCKLANPEASGKWAGVEPAVWKGMNNIKIENNNFEDWNIKALHVVSADNIYITNNHFALPKNDTDQYIYSNNAHIIEQNNQFEEQK